MKANVADLLSLDGQVALITGAATGIGEGIAGLLADAGARIVILDIDQAGAEAVVASIRANGGEASALRLDVTDFAAVGAALRGVVDACGGIDVLVNNAGSYRAAGKISDMTPEVWRSIMAVNLDVVFNCSKVAAQQMIAQGCGGAIVNIASVDGLLPCIGVNDDTAKAGVIHFTRALALDLSPHRIRVNAVAGRRVAADHAPAERRQRPEQSHDARPRGQHSLRLRHAGRHRPRRTLPQYSA